jgi:hypothetical protein
MKYGNTELQGKPLVDELNRYGRPYLEEVFGKQWSDDVHQLAKDIEIGTRKNPSDAGGLMAATIGMTPLKHLPQIAHIFVGGELLAKPAVITYLSRGFGGAGMDGFQKALGNLTQAGINYESVDIPKKAADNSRALATRAGNTRFGQMVRGVPVGVQQ